MANIDIHIGSCMVTLRNQLFLHQKELYAIAAQYHKDNMDVFSLEQNADYLDSLRNLKKGIDRQQKWADANKELIVAGCN
jgi:hypothetical protein